MRNIHGAKKPNHVDLESSRYFYRYRSLDGKSKAHVKESILNSEYYFSSPKAFNDPFDCRPVFRFNASKTELVKYYEGVLSRQAPHLSRDQRRAEARARMSDPNLDPRDFRNLDGFYKFYDQAITSKIGILCLSTSPSDILMWSHYANSHSGICLQFSAINNVLKSSLPVRYEKLRPAVNPVSQNHDEMLDHSIFTKSDHWVYEQEWRLIQYKQGAGIYRLPPEALVGVVLGAQISDVDKSDVLQWIDERSSPTKVYQARVSESKFEIEMDEIRQT
jgi:hypothetical protein